MTDEIQATPVAAPVEAPVVAAPTVAPAVVEAPVVAPAAPVEASKAPETVLSEALAPKAETPPVAEVPKADPAAAPEAEKKTVEGQSDEPAPLEPVYDPFTLPENVQLDEERVKAFTDILKDFEKGTKADHAEVQQFGQKAVDFHLTEIQNTITNLNKFYEKSWEEQKVKWKEEFLADPEIGGNRFQTTVDSALNFIRMHGGTPEQQTEFRAWCDSSGQGNNKVLIRLLANAGKAMAEGQPLAANKPLPIPKSRVETLYGKNR